MSFLLTSLLKRIANGIRLFQCPRVMLCDKCQKREATNFVTSIVDERVAKSNLCEECYQASAAAEPRVLAASSLPGCRYCGAASTASGSDFFGLLSSTQKLRHMCGPCTEEYNRFTALKVPAFGEFPCVPVTMTDLRATDLAAIFAELEAHMKKWVSERRAK